MAPTQPISTRRSQFKGTGCATVAMTVFGLMFLAIGVGVGWFVSGVPIRQALAARDWQPARCQILSNKLSYSSSSDGHGDTSRIAVSYRYDVGGHSYTGSRYDFSVGYDNFANQSKQDFIDSNPPGKEIDCFVDPQHPAESVLDRSMQWRYGFGLIFTTMFGLPGVFLAGAALFMKRRASAEMPVGGAAAAAASAVTFAPVPAGKFGEMTFADTGPLVLAPAQSPIVKLLVLLMAFFFWNGIIALFTWLAWGQEQGSIAMRLFLIPFQLIGLLIAWGVIYQVMSLFNPRPILTLGRARVRLGESLPLQWQIRGGAGRIGTLRIVLIGREEATYTRGTDTKTDKHEFYKVSLVDASERSRIEGGMTTLNIPPNSMHTFTAAHNKIVWTLQVTGEIRLWPDLDESFDITVLP